MSDLASIGTTINSINESISGITSIFDSLYSKIEDIQKKKLSTNNLLKAYYFEVVNNIELLQVIRFDVFRNEKPNSLIVKSMIDKIETQLGAAVLFQENINDKTDLYKFLEDKGKINNKDQGIVQIVKGKEKQNKQNSFYENVLQAISFTVVKTEVLRKLTTFLMMT
jgi:hypothetical protein